MSNLLNTEPIEIPEFFSALIGETLQTVTSEVVNVYDSNRCVQIIMDSRRVSLGEAEEILREEYQEKYFDQQSPIFFKLIEG